MINESEIKNIEFYKDLYSSEHERSKFYDKIIQYPTTIVVIFIGGVIYCFNKYFNGGFPDCFSTPDWVFTILLGLFLISVGITIYFLYYVFHGFSRRYSYLPLSSNLYDYEKQLFRYNFRYSEKSTKGEKIKESQLLTCRHFSEVMKNYYIKLADENQRINDKRADKYYLTRAFLFIDLVLFVSIALISFIN